MTDYKTDSDTHITCCPLLFFFLDNMAQGLKKLSKSNSNKKKKKPAVQKVKKGARFCAPKKNTRLQEQAVKKQIQKGINANIEEALNKAMANDTHKFAMVKKALVAETGKSVKQKS